MESRCRRAVLPDLARSLYYIQAFCRKENSSNHSNRGNCLLHDSTGINTLCWKNQETYFWLHRFSFLFHMDIIAWGCVGAFIAFYWSKVVQFLAFKVFKVLLFATFIITLPYTAQTIDGYGIETVFGPTLEGLGAILIIIVSVAKSDLFLFRILNLRPVIWLGTISYSLYLWHSVFTGNLLQKYGISQNLWILASIGAAMISYYLIERPFVRYRKSLR